MSNIEMESAVKIHIADGDDDAAEAGAAAAGGLADQSGKLVSRSSAARSRAFAGRECESISVSWHNLSFKVPYPKPTRKGPPCGPCHAHQLEAEAKLPEFKQILKGMSGVCQAGTLLAIMGSSGAGKTTFLNALSGRTKGFSGDVLFNGQPLDNSVGKRLAYIEQSSLFYESLTVKEHLTFHARLKLPESIPMDEKHRRVEAIMSELGLKKIENNRIGQVGAGGISGGERRRLAIGESLITDPVVLLVDEPTSGLDSFMAENVINVLKKLAESGRTVLATIHQPASDVYALFDDVLYMANGRVAFHGSTEDAVSYFDEQGFPCAKFMNPADHIIKIISLIPSRLEESTRQVNGLLDNWENSHPADEAKKGGGAEEKSAVQPVPSNESRWVASFWTQFTTLMERSWIVTKRDPTLTKARVGQTIFFAVLVSLMYLQIDNNQTGIRDLNGAAFFIVVNQVMTGLFGVLQVFPLELRLFMREFKSNMYRVDSFFLAKTFSELPGQIMFPAIFMLLSYYVVGFRDDFVTFLGCIFVIILTANTSFSLGYCISAVSPSVAVALALGPITVLPLLLLGGFFLNTDSVPPYFLWLEAISPFSYGFKMFTILQWDDFTGIRCDAGERCTTTTGNQVLQDLGNNPDDFWQHVGIMVGLLVGFRLLAYIFLVRRSKKDD